MTEQNYVYIYYDPRKNNEPFYVGKGSGNRAWTHLKQSHNVIVRNKINTICGVGREPNIGIYGGLDEELAHLLEIELIEKFGRICDGTGTLANIALGGGGVLGCKWTEQRKKNMSVARRGKALSEETKHRISAATKGKRSSETKQKMSIARKGKALTAETKEKMRLAALKRWNKE